MVWDENLTNLNYVLAGLYPLTRDAIRIVDMARLPKIHIAFSDKGIDNWHAILDEANKRGKVIDVIRAAQQDYPDDPFLIQAEQGQLKTVRGPIIDKDVTWKSDYASARLEKILGHRSTLVPISFLEVGIQRARSVARVVLANGALGSGFLIRDNVFVTNHHVISSKAEARTAAIQFNYQQDFLGRDLQSTAFQLDPDMLFLTSVEDDWTVVRMRGDANADWGAIEIQPTDISVEERVNIIQHPGGGPKQVSYFHNIIAYADHAYADQKRVQYLTDTMPGSSGSPVFDKQWRLVAVHHSGGWILEPGTGKQVFRNEGIHVRCIIDALTGT
jgi:hypothetical protein